MACAIEEGAAAALDFEEGVMGEGGRGEGVARELNDGRKRTAGDADANDDGVSIDDKNGIEPRPLTERMGEGSG